VHGDWDAPGPVVGSVEFIRQSVDADMLVADGTQVVDGRELLRLRYAPTGGERPDTTILVDPDTYRPVLQIDGPQDITDVNGVAHHFSRRVTRFEYLPRTAENLALLSPPIPDGFTEVSSEELQQVDCG
jgi:hypothetical protein